MTSGVLSNAESHSPRFSKSQLWMTALSTLLVGLMLWGIIMTVGYVEGEEFSPTHFQTREFSFYEIPIVHWQITPITRKSNTHAMSTYLTQKKLIRPPAGLPGVWHLVWLSRGNQTRISDDASLLVQQLNFSRGGNSVWKTWSQDHPKLAAVLWPKIGTLAERELYVLVPQLLERVRVADDPATFDQEIRDHLREQYTGLIRDMRAAGRIELADTLQAESMEL